MTYIEDILTGILVFPLLAMIFTMPYCLYQYHRYGAISKLRTLIIYSFILYMLIAYFMVILPLPDRGSTIGSRWQDHLNLIPCNQIMIYWSGKKPSLSNVFAYLKSFSLWQLLFNVLLTLPFGIYLRYYFKQSFGRTVFFSFLLSLFYELTQLSALYGIYPGPYRLADIEDLICNTLGGVLGYQIAYLFMMILPDRDAIDSYCRTAGQKVTGWRRFWAADFDRFFCIVVFIVLRGLIVYVMPQLEKLADDASAYFWTVFCLFSFLQTLVSKGYTVGHAICRMVLVSEDGRYVTNRQLLKRYASLWAFTELPEIIADYLTSGGFAFMNDWTKIGFFILARSYFIIYFVNIVFKKGTISMPHDRIAGTVYMAISNAGQDCRPK